MKDLDPYKDNIDYELTTEVYDKNITKWLPFIGSNYTKAPSRILIVGLSHYDKGDKPNWTAALKKSIPNIVSTKEGGMCYDYTTKGFVPRNTSKLHRGIERIFFNVSQPELYKHDFMDKRQKFWSSIAFHQFLETPMMGSSNHSAEVEKEELKDGVAYTRLLRVIEAVEADHVIFLSKHYKYHEGLIEQTIAVEDDHEKRLYENVIPKSEIRTCFLSNGNRDFTFSALFHPSRYKHIDTQHSLLKRTIPEFIDYLHK